MTGRKEMLESLRKLRVTNVSFADDLPFHDEVLIEAHDRPSYDDDPGTGFEVWRAGDRVFISLFWDGADRQVWELTDDG